MFLSPEIGLVQLQGVHAQGLIMALGVWEINACARENDTGRCPCPITESLKAASAVNSNDSGGEGCLNWTDSCEEVGLKPFWKFLYSLRQG